jgi:glycosylphosphatidylinositol transamidase (GPIT) subunit GPI8
MANKEVPLIKAKKTPRKDVVLDPNGFFVIEVDKRQNKIRVEYYSNVYKNKRIVSGVLEKVFLGGKADALCDTIVKNVPDLLPSHYMYLGREIQRAQCALEKNKKYVQGGC